jgi:hypothetical protein
MQVDDYKTVLYRNHPDGWVGIQRSPDATR